MTAHLLFAQSVNEYFFPAACRTRVYYYTWIACIIYIREYIFRSNQSFQVRIRYTHVKKTLTLLSARHPQSNHQTVAFRSGHIGRRAAATHPITHIYIKQFINARDVYAAIVECILTNFWCPLNHDGKNKNQVYYTFIIYKKISAVWKNSYTRKIRFIRSTSYIHNLYTILIIFLLEKFRT